LTNATAYHGLFLPLSCATSHARLQCDLKVKGCSQCQRAKLACHGYRGINDLTFRDESSATAKRALGQATSHHPPGAPHIVWELQARDAFLSLYILKLSHSFDALPSLLAHASTEGHLHASVSAASIALMALQLGQADLLLLASTRYVDAVRGLRLALSNPELPTRVQEVLQTVLLLDLYEKITNRAAQEQGAWMSHAQGAIDILASSEIVEFSSPIICQLANRAVTVAIISCGAAGIPVPDTVASLRKRLSRYVHGAKWSLTGLVSSIVNLRADMRRSRNTQSSTTTSSESAASDDILRRAREIDEQLACLSCKILRFWKPTRVRQTAGDPLVFADHYDLYRNHYSTQVSNAVRIMRLEICQIIYSLDPEEQSNPSSPVLETISDTAQQICAAVPQFLLSAARPENTIPPSPLQLLQCCTLLTALYVCSQATRDYQMRGWVMRCVEYMAESGVRGAAEVQGMLKITPELDHWAVYARIGSYAIAA